MNRRSYQNGCETLAKQKCVLNKSKKQVHQQNGLEEDELKD